MLKKTVLLYGLLALIFSIPSWAALSKSSGVYVEGNIGIANNADWVGAVNAGYKFNGNVALEAGYAHVDTHYIDLAVKAMVPFESGFEVFGKIGPAMEDFHMSKLRVYGGIGGAYSFTPNLSCSLQGFWISNDTFAGTFGLTYII